MSVNGFKVNNVVEKYNYGSLDNLPDLEGAMAGNYSTTSTYNVGDYVWYNGALYRCITAITTAEAWTAGHWTRAAIGDDVSDLKNAFSEAIPFPVSPKSKYGTSGQNLRTLGNGETEWVDQGLPTDDQTQAAISAWLSAHPEATTTVLDGSLTEPKLSPALKLKAIKDYVTPEMYGASGDGVTDDSESIENAILSGKPVVGLANSEYLIGHKIIISNNSLNVWLENLNIIIGFSGYFASIVSNEIALNHCTINGNNTGYGTFDESTMAGKIVCDGCVFENMNTSVDGTFSTSWALRVKASYGEIINCIAQNNLGHGLMVYANDDNTNAEFYISNCKASNNGNSSASRAVGIGSYSPANSAKCIIDNCSATGSGASGIAPHGINNVIISNCISYNNGEHGIVVQQSNDSIVTGCNIKGNSVYGIRVQGDFSLSAENRFVHNVSITDNLIDQSFAVKIGVKATNIIIANNTIIQCRFPFSTDNDRAGRNEGSSNVVCIGNKIEITTNSIMNQNDYFNGFVIKDNSYLYNGKIFPDGFCRLARQQYEVYVSFGDCRDCISPSNTKTISFWSPSSVGATYTDGVLTLPEAVTENDTIGEFRIPINDVLAFYECLPDKIVPWVRFRDSDYTLIPNSEYVIYDHESTNGYIHDCTITIVNNDKANISYACLVLRANDDISADTYSVPAYAADGYKIHTC